jgi:hypothetical protein
LNGFALQSAKNEMKENFLAAVRQNGYGLQSVKDMMEEILLDLIKEQLLLARTKYGKEIYNMTLGDLRREFGELSFPSWIVELSDGDEVHIRRGYDFETMQLWETTEDFCYKNQYVDYDGWDNNQPDHSRSSYLRVFVEAFKYE